MSLRVWAWDMAIDQLEDAAEAYQKEHSDVEFVFEELSSDTIYDKLTTVLASGQGLPDIVAIEGEMFAVFAEKFPDRFADFTGMVEESDFLKNKIAECKIGGVLRGLPWDAAPVAMFYRQDLFDQAGVNADEIVTWDDFAEAGKIVKQKTGVDMSATYISNGDTLARAILYSQNSAFFDADGNLTMGTPEMVRTLSTVKKLYDDGIIVEAMDWSDYISKLADGKSATVIDACWIMGTLKNDCPNSSGAWRAMKMPQIDEASNYVATNGGAILAATSVNDAQRTAAMDYLVFATTDLEMNINGMTAWGLYPSYIPAYDSLIFKEADEYFGGTTPYVLINELAQMIPEINYTQYYSEARAHMKTAVAQVCLEGASPDDVSKQLQEDLLPFVS